MYSTLLSSEEYDPLLIVYLTTTGATLQNHTRAQLIAYALRQVVARMGGVPVTFDVSERIRGNLQAKRDISAGVARKAADAGAAQLTKEASIPAPGGGGPTIINSPAVYVLPSGSPAPASGASPPAAGGGLPRVGPQPRPPTWDEAVRGKWDPYYRDRKAGVAGLPPAPV